MQFFMSKLAWYVRKSCIAALCTLIKVTVYPLEVMSLAFFIKKGSFTKVTNNNFFDFFWAFSAKAFVSHLSTVLII